MLAIRDFSWSDYFWTAQITLESWAGFLSRGGPYGSLDSPDGSKGLVTVVFAPEGRDESPLTQAELDLVNWAVSHERAIRDSALETLLSRYDAMRADFLEWIESPDEMPPVDHVDGFKRLIGLSSVNVHQISKDGMPYVGLQLGCTWDAEHGLGVLMHGARVVDIGGADTAGLLWMAKRDAMRSNKT